MAARSDTTEIDPARVGQLLSDWFASKNTESVAFRQEINPRPDEDARYRVIYEAQFEPAGLDQARVEIWVTADGEAAIGFEKRRRISQRLGKKAKNNRFVAGHEPRRMSETGLIAILDSIAAGQIAVSTIVLPFFGLVSTNAVVTQAVLDGLRSRDYLSIGWLKVVNEATISGRGHFLQFHGWT